MSRRDPLEPLRRIRRMAVDEAKAGLAGAMRGEDSAPMASWYPPAAELAAFTLSVRYMPAAMAGTEMGGTVPEGEGFPSI